MFKRKFIDRLRDKYQTGGYKNPLDKVTSFGLKALGAIPKIARFSGSKILGIPAMMLGANKAYAAPITDTKTGINRFTGEQEYRPFLRNRQTGGMYEQMQQYQSGGEKKRNKKRKKAKN